MESEVASDASGIMSSGKMISQQRVNNLHSLTDKKEIETKKMRGKTRWRRKGKHSVERGGVDESGHEASLVAAVTENVKHSRDRDYIFPKFLTLGLV